jgi:hypothetical protein
MMLEKYSIDVLINITEVCWKGNSKWGTDFMYMCYDFKMEQKIIACEKTVLQLQDLINMW